MTDKNTFIEMVRSVEKIAKASDKPLSEEDIAGYFKDMDLSDAQQKMVCQYLLQSREEMQTDEQEPEKQYAETKLPESAFFHMYLQDMQKITPCTRQEESILYEQLVSGDEAALHKLSEQWLSRVLKLAQKCTASAEELPDVIQEGNMGVFLALEKLRGSGRKADYIQLLTNAANEAMEGYLLDSGAAGRMEQSILVKASLVYEAQKFLTEEFQRIPSMKELSQYTRIPVEELEDILAMLKQKK